MEQMQVICRRKSMIHKSLQVILEDELIVIQSNEMTDSPGGIIVK
jgi:hypothetical protein